MVNEGSQIRKIRPGDMATNSAKAEGLAASAVVGLVDLIRREKEVMEPTALGYGNDQRSNQNGKRDSDTRTNYFLPNLHMFTWIDIRHTNTSGTNPLRRAWCSTGCVAKEEGGR